MMKTLKFFTVVIALFFSMLSSANALSKMSTKDFLDVCLSADEDGNGICQMYIAGFIEGMTWGFTSAAFQSGFTGEQLNQETETLMGACIPQSATIVQTYEITLQYMRNNPQIWHEPAFTNINKAFMEAFPCE